MHPCQIQLVKAREYTERAASSNYAYSGAFELQKVFFEGYPPLDALIRKWNTLLGVAEDGGGGVIKNAPRNPPWVLCCIKSYYLNKNDVWGSRKFRIFDTKLVC